MAHQRADQERQSFLREHGVPIVQHAIEHHEETGAGIIESLAAGAGKHSAHHVARRAGSAVRGKAENPHPVRQAAEVATVAALAAAGEHVAKKYVAPAAARIVRRMLTRGS